jgi:hypothetical protein
LLSWHDRPRLVVGGGGSTANETVRDDDLWTSATKANRFIPSSGIGGVLPALPVLGFSDELATAVEGTLIMAVKACLTLVASTVCVRVFVMLAKNSLFVLSGGLLLLRVSFTTLAAFALAVFATFTFAFKATLLVRLSILLLLLLRRRRWIPPTSGYGRFRQRSSLRSASVLGIMAKAAIVPKLTDACVTHLVTHAFGAVTSFTFPFTFAFALVSFVTFS